MSAPIIRAELSNGIATAGDVSAQGNAPVLNLCRLLVATGAAPASQLHVYRGVMLVLRVRTIGGGAKLTIREDDHAPPRLVRWKAFSKAPQLRRATPQIAQTAPSRPRRASRAETARAGDRGASRNSSHDEAA